MSPHTRPPSRQRAAFFGTQEKIWSGKKRLPSGSESISVRHSIQALQEQYDSGDKEPLEKLIRAWIGVKSLPPEDPRSFFKLAGYHGAPFTLRSDTKYYWGGYCNHANVLFPTWHRAYLLKMEQALQSFEPDVMMPFWDATDEYSLNKGIPSILTQATFELDGETIDNPLKSYVLQAGISDMPDKKPDKPNYTKPKGYETVRYPLSGLVSTPEERAASERHNAQYPYPKNVELLNQNVLAWLKGGKPTVLTPNPQEHGIHAMYQDCLRAPNYTVFSNTTSAAAWNKEKPGIVMSLEPPHNNIHLAVGGFDWPGDSQKGQIAGANGDMGENNTSSFDPIFFFHHSNVDRLFWRWQVQTGHTDSIDIMSGYPGTNSNDGDGGPATGIAPNTPLTLDTPLKPFLKDSGYADNPYADVYYTSRDVINIETQLGYTYAPGSLDEAQSGVSNAGAQGVKKLEVSGINRSIIGGSFVLRAFADVTNPEGNSKTVFLGYHSVLNRRDPENCANCLQNQEVVAHFPLDDLKGSGEIDEATFRVEIQHKGNSAPNTPSFKMEVKE